MAKRKAVKQPEGGTAVLEPGSPDGLKADPVLEIETFDMVLGIRKIRQGGFAGLWKLVQLDPASGRVVKVLMDASTKMSVMGLAMQEIRKCH